MKFDAAWINSFWASTGNHPFFFTGSINTTLANMYTIHAGSEWKTESVTEAGIDDHPGGSAGGRCRKKHPEVHQWYGCDCQPGVCKLAPPKVEKKWLIIGSTAMYHWFNDARQPKDMDVLTPADISSGNVKVLTIDDVWHAAGDAIIEASTDKVFADPEVLLTLKVSHAHWDIHWDKTMHDINFLQEKGVRVNLDLYEKLIPVWTEQYGKKTAMLNVPVEEFFDDGVSRVYDHDLLHQLVAFNGQPMHTRIRPNPDKAWCSEPLFHALDRGAQLDTATEEILATAIERGRLTANSTNSQKRSAVSKAYKKLCTSMTSGWFARFLILNQKQLLITGKDKWLPHLTTALNNLPPLPTPTSKNF